MDWSKRRRMKPRASYWITAVLWLNAAMVTCSQSGNVFRLHSYSFYVLYNVDLLGEHFQVCIDSSKQSIVCQV